MEKHKFLIVRRNKIVTKELPLIFGISGVARCGKDTLCKHLVNKLEKSSIPCMTLSFATALKQDIDPFLKEKFNISAFTNDNHEKSIIRPLLVSYGTEVWRKLDPDIWIKKIEKRVENASKNKIIVLIPDVRYVYRIVTGKQIGRAHV